MGIVEVIVLVYFALGLILSFMWWHDEYEPQYKYYELSENGVDKPMAVLLLLGLTVFWPFKFFKNFMEGSET